MGAQALSNHDVKELFDLLVQAIKDRKPLCKIEALVSIDPKVLERQDGHKWTILTHACSLYKPRCSSEVVKYLITQCPLSISKLSKNGHAPLHYACGRFYPLETIQLLIYENSLGHKSKVGNTALGISCPDRSSRGENIQYLASQWPAACLIERKGKLPLQCIAGKGSIEIVSFMTDCTMDSIIALLEIVKCEKTALPWKLVAHVAMDDFEVLDWSGSSNKAQGVRTPFTQENVQKLCSYMRNADIQTWLEDLQHQKLINGFVEMNKVRCKELPPAHEEASVTKHMPILECVSDNMDCLFLVLEDNPQLFKNSILHLNNDGIIRKEMFRQHCG